MEREETLAQLQTLLQEITDEKRTAKALQIASEKLSQAMAFESTRLEAFDDQYKYSYIVKRTGPEPEKPNVLLKLIYQSKYEAELAEYRARYDLAEHEYFKEYAEPRARLRAEDEAEKSTILQNAQTEYDEALRTHKSVEDALNANNFLIEKFKNKTTVSRFISYFEDQRVDTLKEAINLSFAEQERRHFEQLLEEQTELLKEIAENAETSATQATEAARRAKESLDAAKELIYRWDHAYDN